MGEMGEKGVAARAVARHLHEAIDRVREDMAKVEFWADAVTGFSAPVPDYDTKDAKVWLPPEQATTISAKPDARRRSRSPRRR